MRIGSDVDDETIVGRETTTGRERICDDENVVGKEVETVWMGVWLTNVDGIEMEGVATTFVEFWQLHGAAQR